MIILVYYDADGTQRIGIRTAQGIAATRMTADELTSGGLEALPELERQATSAQTFLDESELRLAAPIPAPGKILCVGLNYGKHAQESRLETHATPTLFSKFTNAAAAHGEAIKLPPEAREYDYEAELVVVMGRRARRVTTEHALDHVLGYCNGNDLSARDLQFLTGQWLLGKTLDGFMPMGPYLATADEVSEPQSLAVRCWVNGELKQNGTTADMIFGVADLIAYASRYMTLEAGDVIATGTPEGVVFGAEDKRWLRAGDTVEVEVGGLGRLTNTLVEG